MMAVFEIIVWSVRSVRSTGCRPQCAAGAVDLIYKTLSMSRTVFVLCSLVDITTYGSAA